LARLGRGLRPGRRRARARGRDDRGGGGRRGAHRLRVLERAALRVPPDLDVVARAQSPRAMRTPFVVGNWKLNKTIAEALALVTDLKNQLGAVKGVAVGVAPVFTALHAVAKRLEGSPIATCAQDCYW